MNNPQIDAVRAHRLSTAPLRLRLKAPHRSCGFVQGSWWPRSTMLTDELPSLLSGLAPRFGAIDRVLYHPRHWWPVPPTVMKHLGRKVSLRASLDQPNVMTLLGVQFGELKLLVVPPYSDAVDAHAAMTAAADTGDASTPEQLLRRRASRTEDHRRERIALHRWESEGGRVFDHV